MPHQELTPVERFLKSITGTGNEFNVPTNAPDLALLRALSVQGRLRYNVATLTEGQNLDLTPNLGETQFIYSFTLQHTASGSSTVTISNDGMTRMSFVLGGLIQIKFFDSLVGDNNKVFRINKAGANGATRATILSWIENTSRIRDVSA